MADLTCLTGAEYDAMRNFVMSDLQCARALLAALAISSPTSLGKRDSAALSNIDKLIAPAAVGADEVDAEVVNARLNGAEGNLSAAADTDPHGSPQLGGTDLHDSSSDAGIQVAPAASRLTLADAIKVVGDAVRAANAEACGAVQSMAFMIERGGLAAASAQQVAGSAETREPIGYIIPTLVESLAQGNNIVMWPNPTGPALMPVFAATEQGAQTGDSQLLDALGNESWDLRCFSIGDEDVGWRVIEHHMAAPHERVIAEVFEDNPRAAIRAAITREQAQPSNGGE